MKKIEELEKEIKELKSKLKEVKGAKCEVFKRIVGYHREVSQWNKGKKEELKHRKMFKPDVTRKIMNERLLETDWLFREDWRDVNINLNHETYFRHNLNKELNEMKFDIYMSYSKKDSDRVIGGVNIEYVDKDNLLITCNGLHCGNKAVLQDKAYIKIIIEG